MQRHVFNRLLDSQIFGTVPVHPFGLCGLCEVPVVKRYSVCDIGLLFCVTFMVQDYELTCSYQYCIDGQVVSISPSSA